MHQTEFPENSKKKTSELYSIHAGGKGSEVSMMRSNSTTLEIVLAHQSRTITCLW